MLNLLHPVLAVLLTMTITVCAFAAEPPPRFEDFPARERMSGPNAPLALTRKDMEFRTQLRDAARDRPNFAGHYVLTTWGCGAGCVMGAAIDARTGRVGWLPGTVCCWPVAVEDPLAFRLDSALLAVTGLRNEKEGDQGTHYYRIEGLRFVHVRDVPAKESR